MTRQPHNGSSILQSLSTHSGYAVRVAWFFQAMADKLSANSHKRGWDECSVGYLRTRLAQEVCELRRAIDRRAPAEAITKECADVANFAMMIADVYREDEARRTEHNRIASLAEKAGL